MTANQNEFGTMSHVHGEHRIYGLPTASPTISHSFGRVFFSSSSSSSCTKAMLGCLSKDYENHMDSLETSVAKLIIEDMKDHGSLRY